MMPIYILAISIAYLTDCTAMSLGVLSYFKLRYMRMRLEEIAVAGGGGAEEHASLEFWQASGLAHVSYVKCME